MYPAAAKRHVVLCPWRSPRTHVVQAHCCQRVNLTTGLPKIRQGGELAGLAEYPIIGINDGRWWAMLMIGA